MPKIAVILAGCGRLDGSEIHESVLTLLSIAQAQASYQCFSPDALQDHVTNHLSNEEVAEKRNMLVESARIARGDVKPLTELKAADFDAIIIPGGNGIAANLFSLAQDGANYQVNPVLADLCRQFTAAQKPAGFICIAPLMIPAIYDFPVQLTIGNDPQMAQLATARGASHHQCQSDEIWVDHAAKIVTTPAYMLANSIAEAYSGIKQLVDQVIALI